MRKLKGKQMEKLQDFLKRYLNNNNHFNKSDSIYRKVYLLNALFGIIMLATPVLIFVNIFVFKTWSAAAVNMTQLFLSIMTAIYFKKTNNHQNAARILMVILGVTLLTYFNITGNQHYGLVWIGVIPPIVYFLLNKKEASILTTVIFFYLFYFMLTGAGIWQPAPFDDRSIFNIIVSTTTIMLMIAFFEKSREEAWQEQENINKQLVDSQNELRLIMDTSAEGIYGIDLEGNCTFCNKSCLKLLGYEEHEQLLGKNMHRQIHYAKRDGSEFPVEECNIYKALRQSDGTHISDEVFYKADGTTMDVEYYSYPQFKDGKITGAVVTFLDISDRRRKEAEIEYLSCHDLLTGLYNRRYFESESLRLDNASSLPLSVIYADINGLKLTNDIFGHQAGDQLIKKSAEILVKACRKDDIVARIGGDEFIVFLPRTSGAEAETIVTRIKEGFKDARIEAIKCSISLGLETRDELDQPIQEIFMNAENAMYRDKTNNRISINKDIIDTILDTLHGKMPEERRHSQNVSELCATLGEALKLPNTDIHKLRTAGILHDIGKIVLDDKILKKENLTLDEIEDFHQHSVYGYRILSLFDDMLDIAEHVYSHHERWDGKGYPKGLKGVQIPLLSRIISVAETYERILYKDGKENWLQARQEIEEGKGSKFDPMVCKAFLDILDKKEENEST